MNRSSDGFHFGNNSTQFNQRLNVSSNHPIIQNTNDYFVYKKYVSIHSEDRDMLRFPDSSQFEIELPEELTNVTLSENSLEADLSLASFCVYRSSALGIQCLPYGVTPIHFSHLANGDLDPLSLTSLAHPQIYSSEELANFLKKFSGGVKGKNTADLRVYRSIFNAYFQEIDEKKLLT